jgi:hypothetical protein
MATSRQLLVGNGNEVIAGFPGSPSTLRNALTLGAPTTRWSQPQARVPATVLP